MKIICVLILFSNRASAFVSNRTPLRFLSKTQCSVIRLYSVKTNPVVVVGNTNEALGSAMAICARDLILDRPDNNERRSAIPPPQPIAFYNQHAPWQDSAQQQRLSSETISSLQNAVLILGPFLENYENILENSLQLLLPVYSNNDKKLFYTNIELGSEEGSNVIQSLSVNQDKIPFLGLNLNAGNVSYPDDGKFITSRENADDWGNKLQSLLDRRDPSSAAVSMGVRTHLAMLQANSLPRCRGALGEKDTWAIRDTIRGDMHVENGDGMLFEYQFNYNDPFGGCDPLMCSSVGYIVPSTSSNRRPDIQKGANDAFAAAYATMIGLGMDSLCSICVATSIKSLFLELGRPPSYTWNNMDEIVKRSIKSFQNVRVENGLPRKMYKDFGYK